MSNIHQLVTDHIDTWTAAQAPKKSGGRGKRSSKTSHHGIQKLRQLILELAVRGKLVPQDANDEPASVLLERIAERKEKLIKEKKIKKQKLLPPVTEEEKPFELPPGWAIERVGNLTEKLGSGSTPRGGKTAYVDDGIPFLRSQNIWSDGIKLEDIAYIPQETHDNMDNTKVYPGDVLLNITGASLGRSTIFPEELSEANVSQHVTIIRLLEKNMGRFMHLGILSPMIQRFVWGRQVGMAIEGLSKKVLEMFEFPIPPLAEQYRIASKVEELMALCDQLEHRQENQQQAHQTLVTTLLNGLLESAKATDANIENAGAFFEQRIAEHFDTLFTTEQSIDQLKQSILQLAVMGKLVPQEPNDQPASELLKKIAAEKAKLIKEKKIKKQKPLPEITYDEKPFALPVGWEWCRHQQMVTLLGDGLHGTPNYDDLGSYFFVNGNNLNDGVINIKPETKRVNETEYLKYKKELNSRTIFVSINGTLGNVAFFNDEPIMLGKSACYFNLGTELSKLFIKRLIESPYFLNYAFASATGSTIKNLGLKSMNNFPVALPPLEEQHRIVAKVDQLMAICDQLKQRLADAQTTQLHLADAMAEQTVG
ncbi:restriction endonuclease subunit S [Pseudomonadota bacterium]